MPFVRRGFSDISKKLRNAKEALELREVVAQSNNNICRPCIVNECLTYRATRFTILNHSSHKDFEGYKNCKNGEHQPKDGGKGFLFLRGHVQAAVMFQ